MSTFANISLSPGGIVTWLVVGLFVGWLAGQVVKDEGYGNVVDIFVGLFGAVLGATLFGLLVTGPAGFWSSLLFAFLGAGVLLGLLRFVAWRSLSN
jgi:uncharacterized membrane protein YeaQ/YmgE (transglycosylase-associated protein family)